MCSRSCTFVLIYSHHPHEDGSGASMSSLPFLQTLLIMALLFIYDRKAISAWDFQWDFQTKLFFILRLSCHTACSVSQNVKSQLYNYFYNPLACFFSIRQPRDKQACLFCPQSCPNQHSHSTLPCRLEPTLIIMHLFDMHYINIMDFLHATALV